MMLFFQFIVSTCDRSVESPSTYGSLSLTSTDGGNEHYAVMPMNGSESTYSTAGLIKK